MMNTNSIKGITSADGFLHNSIDEESSPIQEVFFFLIRFFFICFLISLFPEISCWVPRKWKLLFEWVCHWGRSFSMRSPLEIQWKKMATLSNGTDSSEMIKDWDDFLALTYFASENELILKDVTCLLLIFKSERLFLLSSKSVWLIKGQEAIRLVLPLHKGVGWN